MGCSCRILNLPQRQKVVFDVYHNLANSEPHMGENGPDLFRAVL